MKNYTDLTKEIKIFINIYFYRSLLHVWFITSVMIFLCVYIFIDSLIYAWPNYKLIINWPTHANYHNLWMFKYHSWLKKGWPCGPYHARCVNCESTEQAITSVLIFLNSPTLSLKAMISVGHTKVLQYKEAKGRMNTMIFKSESSQTFTCISIIMTLETQRF